MRLVQKNGILPCKEITSQDIRKAGSPLASRILFMLSENGPMHAARLAEEMGVHEQKVYYHIRNLRYAGMVELDRIEEAGGATAKVLRLASPSFAVRFSEFEPSAGGNGKDSLPPFVMDGKMECSIVVGSPDPHGPEGARGRDASYAIDLGIFIGTFLEVSPPPSMILDIELMDWNKNLIIIGGPIVNKAADSVLAGAPIEYDRAARTFLPGKGGEDETVGFVMKFPNPKAEGKSILWLAGRRYSGTRAAILAFTQRFAEVWQEGGTWLKVVRGIDADSDGIVDSVQVIE